MRIIKIFFVVLSLVAIMAGVVLIAPADFAYRYIAPPAGQVSLSGISGTLWKGHAEGVMLLGQDVGELDWSVDKAPLLSRQLIVNWRLKGADVDATGTLVLSHAARQVEARDVRFRFPAALLAPVLNNLNIKLLGTVSGTLAGVTVRNGWVQQASGNARWSDTGVMNPSEVHFGDFVTEFNTPSAGLVTGTLRDDGRGNLELTGIFSVKSLFDFEVQAQLVPRNDDPQIHDLLRHLGEPQTDGSLRLTLRSNLPRLF